MVAKKKSKSSKTTKFEKHKLELRYLRPSDYEDVRSIMDTVFSKQFDGAWTKEEFERQISIFPEGQIAIEDKGKVIAGAISMIVKYSDHGDAHKYDTITGGGGLSNHNPDGDTLYGVDVFVNPKYQGLRLGRRLYDARKEVCEKLNLRRIIVGGWLPGYKNHEGEMTPQEYVNLVKQKELFDPVLSFQLANDFHVRKIVTNYFPANKGYSSYACLLEWLNIYYQEKEELIGGKKTVVRVGAVQWQMRSVKSFEELRDQVEFFVDTVASYNADFVLFPEFFYAPLLTQFNKMNASNAVRALADYTEKMRDEMVKLAVSYNINIITGSMFEYEDQELRNVSFLCRRDGTHDVQYKLHATPDERSYWGVIGGDTLRVFETDAGRIGILICYDVEFPELARILCERGIDILFVPYYTDTKNGYLRVRKCAQARAIENEIYVVMTGSVGNLPNIENMDIQYSQSAVFTPSDFSFPHDAIAAEATPNTEMTLIADLDLDLLKEVRKKGSVRNMQDRRLDLFRIEWLGKIL
ncbi:MAG: bifunctional GNAT family N-acetyltransferase/carbon-nitrogen hydrolase family protein [Leptospira sp.]|nr:bifunctional GNAT family N-acetyltransferase/carbon-nitrogen hydrolase family protein [Leptospira sp.]